MSGIYEGTISASPSPQSYLHSHKVRHSYAPSYRVKREGRVSVVPCPRGFAGGFSSDCLLDSPKFAPPTLDGGRMRPWFTNILS